MSSSPSSLSWHVTLKFISLIAKPAQPPGASRFRSQKDPNQVENSFDWIQIYNPTTPNCLNIFLSKTRHCDPSPFFWKSNRTPPPIEKNLGNMSSPKTDSFPFEEPFNFSLKTCNNSTSGIISTSQPFLHPGVSRNSGTPKWMVYNGKPY